LIDNIEQNLTVIKNNIDEIMKNRQKNLSEIRQQRQMFQDQIKQMRVKINSHLDTLEHNILRIDKIPPQYLWFIEIQSGQQGLSWC
jgi:GTP1/Obg family GTP-binding protein